ncbi:polysaccharide export protein, translocase [Celeribacter indicus]|uniref:Polysaccharide export protein, translocase n=1 Tax=Celeribacter indicus TaxID=1208324 RepID=A0A0B5DPB0_9RHOB|nr:polysaccharide export protein, translocase [Celeribacter indicus]
MTLVSSGPPRSRHVKSALGIGALKVATLPLTILLSIVLARALGPADYGRYAFAVSLATVLALPAGPGINALVLRETAQAAQAKDFALMAGVQRRARQAAVFCTGAIWLAGLVYALTILDGDARDSATLLGAMLLFPPVSLLAIQAGLLQGLHHPFASQVGQLALRPGLGLLFVLGGIVLLPEFTLGEALAAQIAATLVALAGSLWILRRLAPPELARAAPRYEDRAWRAAVLPFALIAFTNTFNAEIGILVLGAYGMEGSTAALRVATSGAQLLSFPLFINNMILAPQAAQMFRSGEIDALKARTRRFARITFLVSALAGIPLILFAAPILALTFGPDYVATATLPLQILAFGHLGNVAVGPVAMLLSMAGHEKAAFRGQALTLVIVFALALALAPAFGATGAAFAVAFGTVVGRCVLALLCVRTLHFRPTVV